MISNVNSSAIRSAYATNAGEPKESKQLAGSDKASSAERSKAQELKESIDSGTYKVDLQAVAEKMAQDLL